MEWLREIPMFKAMTNQQLAEVAKIVQSQSLERGEFVFFEGAEKTAVYFIRTGAIKVYKVDEEGREQIISYLRTGDMFPHVGLFDDLPYPGTAEALSSTSLGLLPVRQFEQLLQKDPQIALTVLRVLSQKILELQQKLQDATLQSVSDRVLRTLIHLSEWYGEKRDDGRYLALRMTNRELANMIGTTRESVNRILNDLKKQGLIEIRPDGIWISHHLLGTI